MSRTPLLCSLLLLAGPVLAAENVAIVLDASGSMWGQIEGRTKIEIAREAVGRMVSGWDAGNGIGPVLRRGPIAQHFHTLDGQQRDGIQIHPRAPPANGAIHVQERALVQTFAVDEHQHLIGVERAQREGWCMVGAIGNRWVRGIQTGHQRCQSPGKVALPH